MAKDIIVLGGGGHARVLIETLRAAKREIAGIVDRDPAAAQRIFPDLVIVGNDDALLATGPTGILLVNGIGGAGDTGPRRDIFLRFKDKGFQFATVVHPSAVVACGVELAEGVQVLAGTIIQPGANVGENSLVNTGATIDHDGVVGAHCHIAPGVNLSGGVQVGRESHIGTGASVIQRITIGCGCIIGAGAVVVRDVPDNFTAIGVPAQSKKRFSPSRRSGE